MGTPAFSVPTLARLTSDGHDIAAVYSQPPRAAGRRGLEQRKTPVHEFADSQAIEVRTPASLKPVEEHEAFAALRADVAIVVAYGLLLPKPVLQIAPVRLSQCACIPVAALARGSPHTACHHGG